MKKIYIPKAAFPIPTWSDALMNSFNFPLSFKNKRYITDGHVILDMDYAANIIDAFNQHQCVSDKQYFAEMQRGFESFTTKLEKGTLTKVYLKKDKYKIDKKDCARFESGLLENGERFNFYVPRNQIVKHVEGIKYFTLNGRELYVTDKLGNLIEIIAAISPQIYS